jgi:hypothetical protein
VDAHNDRRVNEFLQQIDGFAGKNPNLLLLGATNRPWDIDSAAVRSGRFSQKIYISLPDAPALHALYKLYTKNVPLGEDVDFNKLVEMSKDFSGADVAEVVDRAKEEPLDKYIRTGTATPLTQNDFIKAIKSMLVVINRAEIKKFEVFASGEKFTTPVKNGGHLIGLDALPVNEAAPSSLDDIDLVRVGLMARVLGMTKRDMKKAEAREKERNKKQPPNDQA